MFLRTTIIWFVLHVLFFQSVVANELMKFIYNHQHPDPSLCSQKRLLVIHSNQLGNFEGTGSILKLLAFGLAQAIHSNRILVWGRYVPKLYSQSNIYECSDPHNGGIFNCFFERLSSCTYFDISEEELEYLADNGYNHTRRVMLQEPRKGLAFYFPPTQFRNLPNIKVLWPATQYAYIFRLRNQVRYQLPDGTYCAHVRHGDVKALSDVYQNRKAYSFETYLKTLKKMSSKRAPPLIYVASDSTETADAVRKWKKNLQLTWNSCDYCYEYVYDVDIVGHSYLVDKRSVTCDVCEFARTPIVQEDRFREKYGSHTTASGPGTCYRSSCALPADIILKLQAQNRNISHDVFHAVNESITDLVILSQCDGLVATATSHFSTGAALLSWYRQQHFIQRDKFVFLDEKEVAEGLYESSYLLGTYNAQTKVTNGKERWASLEWRWGEALLTPPKVPELRGDPENFYFPTLSLKSFETEVARWNTDHYYDDTCNPENDLSNLVNLGVEHSTWHPGKALYCWNFAIPKINSPETEFAREIVEENIRAIQEQHFHLYLASTIFVKREESVDSSR